MNVDARRRLYARQNVSPHESAIIASSQDRLLQLTQRGNASNDPSDVWSSFAVPELLASAQEQLRPLTWGRKAIRLQQADHKVMRSHTKFADAARACPTCV